MLKIKIEDSKQLNRALKQFKKKLIDTKVLKELRERMFFEKKSEKKRKIKKKAIYKEKKFGSN